MAAEPAGVAVQAAPLSGWQTSGRSRASTPTGHGWRQINRALHPMMWLIFWPGDTDFSDPANTRHPSEDAGTAARYIGE